MQETNRQLNTRWVVGIMLLWSALLHIHTHSEHWVVVAVIIAMPFVALPLVIIHERREKRDASYADSRSWRRGRARIFIVLGAGVLLYLLALIFWT